MAASWSRACSRQLCPLVNSSDRSGHFPKSAREAKCRSMEPASNRREEYGLAFMVRPTNLVGHSKWPLLQLDHQAAMTCHAAQRLSGLIFPTTSDNVLSCRNNTRRWPGENIPIPWSPCQKYHGRRPRSPPS